MKKIFILLTALSLLTLGGCISKDAKGKVTETVPTTSATDPATPTPSTTDSGIGVEVKTSNLITLLDESAFLTGNDNLNAANEKIQLQDTGVTLTHELSNGEFKVLSLTSATAPAAYPWGQARIEVKKAFSDVTAVKIKYKSDSEIIIKFVQPNLKEVTGDVYYQVSLPASSEFKEVTINKSSFIIPSWASIAEGKTPSLDLDNVTALDISPTIVKDGKTYSFVVSNLELINFKF